MKQTLAVPVCPPSTHPREVIGIDLGDRWSRYCVVNQACAVVEEDRVRTTADALAAKFGGLPATRIVIEVGAHSPWVSRMLQAQGHEIVVANPRKVRLIYESDRKNDRLDARMLARLGRADVSLLSPVQHRSREVQADLALVRSRDALVAARTQLINSVRGMVKSMGGRLPRSTTAAFAGKVKLLIPAELKAALEPLVRGIDNLSEQIRRYDERVEQLADKKYSRDAFAAAGERRRSADCLDLCANGRRPQPIPAKSADGQFPGAASATMRIGQQRTAVGHFQVREQPSALAAGAGGALHPESIGARQSPATMGTAVGLARRQEGQAASRGGSSAEVGGAVASVVGDRRGLRTSIWPHDRSCVNRTGVQDWRTELKPRSGDCGKSTDPGGRSSSTEIAL